ncbi:MAG: hypothetical protein VW877_11065 [Pseudomonadaceae bacterium]
MKYTDGEQVKVGDKVLIDGQHNGLVVANIDGDEYSENHPREQWSYLNSGVIIDTSFGGLVHYENNSKEHESIELVSRA